MPVALLIGFEYTFNKLPGAIVDLYHANKWCESFNCDIHILTDIGNNNELQNVINHKIAEEDILNFRNQEKIVVGNSVDLLMNIIRIIKGGIYDDKLIIYYSGHGVKDSMVMPDRTLLSFIDFRNNILNVLDPYIEIFCILDCCNPSGMHLPYKLVSNEFVLSPTKIECITQPMILITSAEADEKSIAISLGSVFSRHLFHILNRLAIKNIISEVKVDNEKFIIPNNKNRNLQRLIGTLSSSIRSMRTGYEQTVSIYSSYVIDPVLWMWIGNSCDLVIDITLSTLVVRNNKEKRVLCDSEENHRSNYVNPYDILYNTLDYDAIY